MSYVLKRILLLLLLLLPLPLPLPLLLLQPPPPFYSHYARQPVSRSPELRTGGFCWSKSFTAVCYCWQQWFSFGIKLWLKLSSQVLASGEVTHYDTSQFSVHDTLSQVCTLWVLSWFPMYHSCVSHTSCRAILYVMHGTFAHFQDMPQIIVYNLETELYVVRQHSRHR